MNRPKRVAYVIDNLAAAGTEKQLLHLLAELDRRLVEPHLVLLDGESDESRNLEPAGVPILRLGVKKLRSGQAGQAALRFFLWLRGERIEILQCYFIDSARFTIPIARLAGVSRTYHVRANCGYWRTGRLAGWDRLLPRLTTKTLTNSPAGRASWIGLGLPASRVEVVANFLPLPSDVFEGPFRGAVPVVGIVANLRPVKNVDGLLRAAALLNDGKTTAEFRIAGDGPERANLERLAGDLGLADRVRFAGSISDVPAFLRGVDIAVNCSHSEGDSNALLEYLAAGKAIVATDVGRNREWLTKLDTGRLADGSDKSLAEILKVLIEDRGDTAKMAERGWANYERAWGKRETLRDWYRLYGVTSESAAYSASPVRRKP